MDTIIWNSIQIYIINKYIYVYIKKNYKNWCRNEFRFRKSLHINYNRTFSRRRSKNYPFYDDTDAFISGKDGEILYLYKDHKNYIVSENGTTYSNLTYK